MSDIRKGWTSASNAPADALCAGRHSAQAGLTEEKSADATGGQAIHDALKLGDPSKLTLQQRDIYDSCQTIEAKLVLDVFGDKAKLTVFREQRYWCKVNAGESVYEHSGQADVIYRVGTRALVLDYKTLQGDVEDSPKNLQLRDLACLVHGQPGALINEVVTAIIQPLVTHSPEVCIYGEDDLARAEAEMFARIAASNAPNPALTAGEVQCKFCLAKKICPAYSEWMGKQLPVVSDNLFSVAMTQWTPEQRALAASVLAPAMKGLEEIKEFLKDGLSKDPAFIPGWTLTAPQVREKINDPQACFDRFAAHGGKLDKFMAGVEVSKTKLKEALHEATQLRGKALDAEMKKLCDGIVTVTNTQPSLRRVEEKK